MNTYTIELHRGHFTGEPYHVISVTLDGELYESVALHGWEADELEGFGQACLDGDMEPATDPAFDTLLRRLP